MLQMETGATTALAQGIQGMIGALLMMKKMQCGPHGAASHLECMKKAVEKSELGWLSVLMTLLY